jgi:cell division protein FtsB
MFKLEIMKNTLISLLLFITFSSAYSQELIEEIKKLTLENDSLLKVIKPLNDEKIKLKEDLKTLEKENKDLETKIKDFSKNKLKEDYDKSQKEISSLKKKVDDYEKEISTYDSLLNQQKQHEVELLNQEKEKLKQEKEIGKQEVKNQILQSYNKPFDDLIITSTLKSVELCVQIVGINSEVNQKLLNLKSYFSSEQVLEIKYDELKVKNALDQIDSLEKTELVKKLTDKLSNYKLRNEALKTTLNKIIEIDEIIASDDNLQKLKLKDILSEFAWYFRNYRFNFSDYPYLSDIILEIIKIKQKNADADIRQFLDKL